MKRTLSLLLTAVLLLGMLPITAAAAAESSNQQIEGGNVPVYYTYNEGTGTFAQDANPTNAVTTNKATDPEVTISKVIQGTGTENQFDITLNVTTTQKVERSPSMPDAAVALVIDKSTSMYYCVNCGKSENHRNHSVQSAGCDLCQRCTGFTPSSRYSDYCATCGHWKGYHHDASAATCEYQSRMDAAKEAAIAFAAEYAASAKDENGNVIAHRYMSLTKFSGTAELIDLNAASASVWIDVAALDWTLGADGQYHNSVVDAINGVNPPSQGDGTNVADPLGLADGALDSLFREQANNDKLSRAMSFVLLLGDGEPNKNGTAPQVDAGFTRYSTYQGQPYSNAEKWVYNIRQTGTKLLSAYVGVDRTADGYLWFNAMSNQCQLAANADELVESFDIYLTLIKISAEAWEVTDPMGANISFVSKQAGEANYRVTGQGTNSETLIWTLRNDIPTVYKHGTSTRVDYDKIKDSEEYDFVYSLTYRVQLDNTGAGADQYGLTNGATYLTYYLTDREGNPVDEQGNLIADSEDLPVLYFKVPKVKGLYADLYLQKQDSKGNLLPGATFTLTGAKTIADTGAGNGNHLFAGIPSGEEHSYTLTEKNAPAGFVTPTGSDAQTAITVKWGKVYVGSTEITANAPHIVRNTRDPQKKSFTVTKSWLPAGSAPTDGTTVSVDIYVMTGATQDGTPIYDAAKAPVDTLELTQGNGWSDTTIQLPTKDEDGNDIAYVAVEQAVTG